MFRSVSLVRAGVFQLAALVVAFQLGHAVPAHAQGEPAPEVHHGDIPLENELVDFEP